MKKKFFVFIMIVFSILINLVAIQKLHSAMGVLQMLKLNENQANESIFSSIINAYWYVPNGSELVKIATGDRVAITKELERYVKSFIKSEGFQQKYNSLRTELMPTKPERPEPMETRKQSAKRDLEESIRNYKNEMSEATSQEDKAEYKEQIESARKELKEIDNPDNPNYSKTEEESQMKWYEQEMQQYKDSMVQWEKDNPANLDKLIKAKLEEFLKESDGIDFNAALVKQPSGKMEFAKKEFEEMSDLRKMCFRAGKNATDEARMFAQEWLKELSAAK
jgi:hypothetical protein